MTSFHSLVSCLSFWIFPSFCSKLVNDGVKRLTDTLYNNTTRPCSPSVSLPFTLYVTAVVAHNLFIYKSIPITPLWLHSKTTLIFHSQFVNHSLGGTTFSQTARCWGPIEFVAHTQPTLTCANQTHWVVRWVVHYQIRHDNSRLPSPIVGYQPAIGSVWDSVYRSFRSMVIIIRTNHIWNKKNPLKILHLVLILLHLVCPADFDLHCIQRQ